MSEWTMELLKNISIVWSMFHVLILFVFLYEPRYSKKKTIVLTILCMGVWLGLQIFMLLWFDAKVMAQWIFITGTIPSLIFFWIMSKRRDGRFLFIFCFCDTIAAEILLATNLIDNYLFGGLCISMLVLRIIMFPLLEWFVFKIVRPILNEVQNSVHNGWYAFAGVSAVFYILLIVNSVFPADRLEDPNNILPSVLIMLLMPLMYWNIFQTLRRQQKIFKLTERDNLLGMEVLNMQQRIEQYTEADEKFRIERHDMRHKLRAISEMVQAGELQELRHFLENAEQKLTDTEQKKHCADPVLDAVFNAYYRRAEERGIRVESSLALPHVIPVDTAELSSALANALENAINACAEVEAEKRLMQVRILAHPQMIIQISNTFRGQVQMDDRGMPVTYEAGHGFGTRSIVAFCEKNNAFWEFKAESNIFTVRIVIG